MAGLLGEDDPPSGGLLDRIGSVWRGILDRQDDYNSKQAAPLERSVARGNLAPWLQFMGQNGINPLAESFGANAGAIKAFHGSPYDFAKFDISKLGTGEGANMYGRGLYFAEKESVARAYRDALKPGRGATPSDTAARLLDSVGGDRTRAMAEMTRRIDAAFSRGESYDSVRPLMDAKNIINIRPESVSGRMYEVNLNAEPQQFLNWDAPLSQQPHVWERLKTDGFNPFTSDARGSVYAPRNVDQMNAMKDAGVPGLKYLDQGSRGVDGGTSNYVVFDPNIVEIMRKYGIVGPAVGAGLLADTEE